MQKENSGLLINCYFVTLPSRWFPISNRSMAEQGRIQENEKGDQQESSWLPPPEADEVSAFW